jgi:flagellar hook protein FlgE
MSFGVSLTGLNGATRELEVRGNNIANVGTTAFKRSRVNFGDLVSTTQSSRPGPTPGIGSRVLSVDQQFLQGSFKSTQSVFDLAIDGDGFFVVSDKVSAGVGSESDCLFCRRGQFFVDAEGFLVDSDGRSLLVDRTPADGSGIGDPFQLPPAAGLPRASSLIDFGVNLPANTPIPEGNFDRNDPSSYSAATSIRLFDSLGSPLNATIYFSRASFATAEDPVNRWDTRVFVGDQQILPTGGGQLVFGTDGKLVSSLGRADYLPFNPGNGADPLVLSVNFAANTSQFPRDFSVLALRQDGFPAEQLDTIEIDRRGNIVATYNSGRALELGRVLMARFTDPNELIQLGNGLFRSTRRDNEIFGYPTDSGIGEIKTRALETSNVNLTDELLGLINAQRMFQSNAKAVEAVSEMTRRMTDRA